MKKLIYLFLGIVTAGSLATADVIVHWSGDYVSANNNLVLPSAIDDGGYRTYAYSVTTPISPSSGYTAPVDRNDNFYGAAQVFNSAGTPTSFALARIGNDTTSGNNLDFIQFTGPSINGNISGLVFFKQADFLNGSDVTLSLSGMSGSINVTDVGGTASIRLAVLNNGSWYLSQSAASGTGAFNVTAMDEINWGAWNPAGAPLAGAPGNYDVSGSTLNDVEALGYYFYAERNGQSRVGVNEITFNGVVVPEPGTVSLLMVGSALLFARRRVAIK